MIIRLTLETVSILTDPPQPEEKIFIYQMPNKHGAIFLPKKNGWRISISHKINFYTTRTWTKNDSKKYEIEYLFKDTKHEWGAWSFIISILDDW